MSNFTNRKQLSEEMGNSIEDRKFNDDSSQSYDSDISSENLNMPISSKNEEHEYSDEEETESDLIFLFWETGIKC